MTNESGVLRIGVTSDTHGNLPSLHAVLAVWGRVDAIFHLGDCEGDAGTLRALSSEYAGGSCDAPALYNVRGNCDFYGIAPEEQVVELGGVRFFLAHGHRLGVDHSADLLLDRALEQGCRVALYGHTHFPSVEQHRRVWVMNPGSPWYPRGGSRRTCGLIEVEKDRVACGLLLV